MTIQPIIKDDLVIRSASEDDAERIIHHVQQMAYDAPDTLPNLPGEFKMTVEEEKAFLTKSNLADNSFFLVAEIHGEIVGILNCWGSHKQAMKHTARLGISVRKAWQSKGIGTALMTAAINCAKSSSVLTRLDLQVYIDNARGIKLYEKMGFVIEGRLRNSIIRNGKYVDDYHMGLIW